MKVITVERYDASAIPSLHWTDPRDVPDVPPHVMASKSRAFQRKQWLWRRHLVPVADIPAKERA